MRRKKIPAEIRKLVYKFYDRKCLLCGLDSYLQIHHKSGDSRDNSLLNLELVCVFCHGYIYHPYKAEEMLEWVFGKGFGMR